MFRSSVLSLLVIAATCAIPASAQQAQSEDAAEAGILLFGGSRGTGLELAKLLVARRDQVTVFVRPTSDLGGLDPLGVRYIVGDALNRDNVDEAFAQGPYRAVVSTLGCFRCDQPPDYVGNKNIFDAAVASGNRRVIMISTVGAGDSKDTIPWIVGWMLEDVIALKQQAEQSLINSGLDYTIVRPGGLKDGDPTGLGILTEDPETMGVIVRADLAGLLVQCIDDEQTVGKIYTAKDAEMTWPWDIF